MNVFIRTLLAAGINGGPRSPHFMLVGAGGSGTGLEVGGGAGGCGGGLTEILTSIIISSDMCTLC